MVLGREITFEEGMGIRDAYYVSVLFKRRLGRVLFSFLSYSNRGRDREDEINDGYESATPKTSRTTLKINSLRIWAFRSSQILVGI